MISGNPQLMADWLCNKAAARETIRAALAQEGGHVGRAAKLLRVSRRTLHRYLEQAPDLAIRRKAGNPQLTVDWLCNKPAARVAIRAALAQEGGHVGKAAKVLRVSRRTLHRYLEQEPELAMRPGEP